MAVLPDTPEQSRSALRRGPVFVDDSGRRLRRLRILGLVALAVAAGYVVLLGVALVGGPNIAAPYLPQPAARTAQAAPSSEAATEESPSATNAPAGGGALAGGGPAAAVVPANVAIPAETPAAAATGSPVQQAQPAPATTAPGKSGTAPGQTRRSSPPHP